MVQSKSYLLHCPQCESDYVVIRNFNGRRYYLECRECKERFTHDKPLRRVLIRSRRRQSLMEQAHLPDLAKDETPEQE